MKKRSLNPSKNTKFMNTLRKSCAAALAITLLSGCCITEVSASEQIIQETQPDNPNQQPSFLLPETDTDTTEAAYEADTSESFSDENMDVPSSENEENSKSASDENSASEYASDETAETEQKDEDSDGQQSEASDDQQDEVENKDEDNKMPELLTANAEYLLGSGSSLTLQLLLNGFTVTGVSADGNTVAAKYLTISGEGAVTISAEYLESLEVGTTILTVDLACEDRTYALTCSLTVIEQNPDNSEESSESSGDSLSEKSSHKNNKKESTDSSDSENASDSSTVTDISTNSTETADSSETAGSASSASDSSSSEKSKSKSEKSSSGSSKGTSKGSSSGGKKSSGSDTVSQEDEQAWLESCSGEYFVYYVNLSFSGNTSAEDADHTSDAVRIVIDQNVVTGYVADGTELFQETYTYSETDKKTGAFLFLSENEGAYHCLVLSGEAGDCLVFRCGAGEDEINSKYGTSYPVICGLLLDSGLTEEERENKAAEVFSTLADSLFSLSAESSRQS